MNLPETNREGLSQDFAAPYLRYPLTFYVITI